MSVTINKHHQYTFCRKSKQNAEINSTQDFPKAEHLQFETDESVEKAIQKAMLSVDKYVFQFTKTINKILIYIFKYS